MRVFCLRAICSSANTRFIRVSSGCSMMPAASCLLDDSSCVLFGRSILTWNTRGGCSSKADVGGLGFLVECWSPLSLKAAKV